MFVETQAAGVTRLQGGKYWVPATVREEGEVLVLKFGFNRSLLAEVKSMAGARWNPEKKYWTVLNNERNWFQLAFLAGHNPYKWFDRPLIEHKTNRNLYSHQLDLVLHGLTYHFGVWAAEMGTGKSLAAIEVMEGSGFDDWLYVGPKSAIASFQLELEKWKCKVRPKIVTYDGLRKLVEHWTKGTKAPQGVIFDESSRIKSPTAQRSQAAYHLAKSIRKDHGHDGFVLLMSGSPAPKSPADWWWQAEVACPGFIREGTIEKFRARLGLIQQKESITGGTYPHLVTWKDDERKCNKCGQLKDHENHKQPDAFKIACGAPTAEWHEWEASVNEISYLYKRMAGLTVVKFKKDCLDLPDKEYRIIRLQPSRETLNAAKIVVAGAQTTIAGLTLLRELSDGFQYQETEAGQMTCPTCKGSKVVQQPIPLVSQDEIDAALESIRAKAEAQLAEEGYDDIFFDADGIPIPEHILLADKYEMQEVTCYNCGGEGEVTRYIREAVPVACPKEDALKDILDAHEEDGRLVVYAGFTGSIDRVIATVEKMGWQWIRVDGRGWAASSEVKANKAVDMLKKFQDKDREIPRLCFVGHAASAGMGLTLTASCEIVYYSNDFNAESRIQSEDRCHRAGMDVNRGCLITDLVHLPSDEKVIENLKNKRRLQDMSLGAFRDALASVKFGESRVL